MMSFDDALDRRIDVLLRSDWTAEPRDGRWDDVPELREHVAVAVALRRAFLSMEWPGAKGRGRQRLLAELEALDGTRRAGARCPAGWHGLARLRRLAYAAVLLTAVVLGSGSILTASGEALPGDLLYPVKQAGEELALALEPNPEAQALLHARYAERRAGELAVLVAGGRTEEAQRPADGFQHHLATAARLSGTLPNPRDAAGRVEQVAGKALRDIEAAALAAPAEAEAMARRLLASSTSATKAALDLLPPAPSRSSSFTPAATSVTPAEPDSRPRMEADSQGPAGAPNGTPGTGRDPERSGAAASDGHRDGRNRRPDPGVNTPAGTADETRVPPAPERVPRRSGEDRRDKEREQDGRSGPAAAQPSRPEGARAGGASGQDRDGPAPGSGGVRPRERGKEGEDSPNSTAVQPAPAHTENPASPAPKGKDGDQGREPSAETPSAAEPRADRRSEKETPKAEESERGGEPRPEDRRDPEPRADQRSEKESDKETQKAKAEDRERGREPRPEAPRSAEPRSDRQPEKETTQKAEDRERGREPRPEAPRSAEPSSDRQSEKKAEKETQKAEDRERGREPRPEAPRSAEPSSDRQSEKKAEKETQKGEDRAGGRDPGAGKPREPETNGSPPDAATSTPRADSGAKRDGNANTEPRAGSGEQGAQSDSRGGREERSGRSDNPPGASRGESPSRGGSRR